MSIIKGLVALAKKPWSAVSSIIDSMVGAVTKREEQQPKKKEGRMVAFIGCSSCSTLGGTLRKTQNKGYICEDCLGTLSSAERAVLFLSRKTRRHLERLQRGRKAG